MVSVDGVVMIGVLRLVIILIGLVRRLLLVIVGCGVRR